MVEGRDDEPLNDVEEALRTLRAELSIEPSAEFQARVRGRIAGRPVSALRWTWLVPAALAVPLAIGVLVMFPTRTSRGPDLATASPAPPSVKETVPLREAPPARTSPAIARGRPRVAARSTVERDRPLVARDEALRLARYVASVRARPFAEESLPYSDPRTPLVEPAEIAPAPLEVTPLVLEEGTDR